MTTHAASLLLRIGAMASFAFAAAIDLKTRIIPDRLVVCVIVAGSALRLLADGSAAWLSFAIALAVFVPLAVLRYRGHIGGGDARMISATTLLVDPPHVFALLTLVAPAGGVLAVLYILFGKAPRTAPEPCIAPAPSVVESPAPALSPDLSAPAVVRAAETELPYGLAVLAGAILTLLLLP